MRDEEYFWADEMVGWEEGVTTVIFNLQKCIYALSLSD